MKKIALFIGCAAALVGSEAKAEVASDNFNPQHTFRPNEFPWESGPIGVSAFSVNLTASAFHEVDIEMTGVGDYDFDAQSLTFIGDDDGGLMENALGVEVGVTVSIDIAGITADFDVGVFNIEETANGTFSPYLLPGDPERPFGVSEAIGPNNLVDTSFTIPLPVIPDAEVDLLIDWTLNVPEIEYRSTEVVLTDGEDSVLANEIGIYANEGEALDLVLPGATPGETSTMFGTLHGTFDAEVSLVFTVSGTVTSGTVEFNIPPIDVPLDFPVNEDEPIEFPPERLQYDVPEAPPAGTSSGGADSSTGEPDETEGDPSESDSDSDSTTGDPPAETTAAGDSSGGGIPADPTGDGDAGCGCSTGQQDKSLLWMVGLLGFALVRRRRDEAA